MPVWSASAPHTVCPNPCRLMNAELHRTTTPPVAFGLNYDFGNVPDSTFRMVRFDQMSFEGRKMKMVGEPVNDVATTSPLTTVTAKPLRMTFARIWLATTLGIVTGGMLLSLPSFIYRVSGWEEKEKAEAKANEELVKSMMAVQQGRFEGKRKALDFLQNSRD